jgi:hypothetical protein
VVESGGQAPALPQLPPAQTNSAFDFEPSGVDAQGRLRYQVRIKGGGSPFLVATSKLTPLFWVDGKDAAVYVSDAYFRANPRRTPSSIQPGDEFTLLLPPDTFIVRWQEEREENFGQRARLREYVSERGDRLRYYLTDPFPISFELLPADGSGRGIVHFHPDLAFMLGTGRMDPIRLARIVYRIPEPDLFQIESMRRLAGELKRGVPAKLELDRTRAYLDPVREALAKAGRTEPVPEPERAHLTRAIIPPNQGGPFLAVEDALGTRTSLSELPVGQVFRIEHHRDGTVRVLYKTGPGDAMGKRDPYLLRENERWSAIYRRATPTADTPIKWGPGEPSDLEPYPTARDPLARRNDPEHRYDYLVPGRVLVVTFAPVRRHSDLKAELEFRNLVSGLREKYKTQIEQAIALLEGQKSEDRSQKSE